MRSSRRRKRCGRAEGGIAECGRRRIAAHGQAARLLRSAARAHLWHDARWKCATSGCGTAFARRSSRSTPARPSSKRTRRTTTRRTRTKTKCRAKQPGKKRIMILGGGPNRIGQGIEFDYCCCHASFALQELGIESVMVNSNPGDGQHRLRHERPAVLRAADGRRRAQHLRPRAAGRRDRAVRRADAAEPGAAAGGRGRADHRHQRRRDRSGRGPREVSAAAAQARPEAAAQRHRPHDGRGPPRGGEDRLSAAWCGRASCSAAGRWKSATTRRSWSGSSPRRSSSPRVSRC